MNNFIKKYLTYICLLTILIIGLYIRIGGVLTNSFAFTYDVGRDMLEVQKIVHEFKIPLIGQTTGLGGLYYGPWWYYILTPSFILFSGNPQGVVLFMVLSGLLAVVLSFYLGKITGYNTLGLIFAAISSFSAVMVNLSNQIWNPNIAPVFVVLSYIFLIQLLYKNKNLIYIFSIGVVLGLLVDSEILFGTLFSISVIFYLLLKLKRKILTRNYLFLLLGLSVIFFPRILFEFRHQFIMTKTLFTFKENSEGFVKINGLFTELPNRIISIFSQFKETISLDNFYLGLFMFFAITITILYNYKKLDKKIQDIIKFSTLTLIVFMLGTSVFDRAIWGHYLVGLPVLYIFLLGITFFILISKRKKTFTLIFVFYTIMLLNPVRLYQDLNSPMWEGNAAVYRNQLATLDYIYADSRGEKFNYITYTPAVHDYPYRYLFSWYGLNKYGYSPSTETKRLFYVIIEPDIGYEQRIKDWLKIRENDGKIISQKFTKGGILVQKRIR